MEGSSEGKSPTQMAAYFMFWEKRKGKEGETVLFFHFENKGSNDTVWRWLFAWELDENLTMDGNLCNIYIELLRTEWNGRRAQGYSYTERLLLSFECEMLFFFVCFESMSMLASLHLEPLHLCEGKLELCKQCRVRGRLWDDQLWLEVE